MESRNLSYRRAHVLADEFRVRASDLSGYGRKNRRGRDMNQNTKKLLTTALVAMAAIAIVERVPAVRRIVKGA
jgi:methyl coenzyme M reductase gamma subunit